MDELKNLLYFDKYCEKWLKIFKLPYKNINCLLERVLNKDESVYEDFLMFLIFTGHFEAFNKLESDNDCVF